MGNTNSTPNDLPFDDRSRFKKRFSIPSILHTHQDTRFRGDSPQIHEEEELTAESSSKILVPVPFSQGRRKPQPVKASAPEDGDLDKSLTDSKSPPPEIPNGFDTPTSFAERPALEQVKQTSATTTTTTSDLKFKKVIENPAVRALKKSKDSKQLSSSRSSNLIGSFKDSPHGEIKNPVIANQIEAFSIASIPSSELFQTEDGNYSPKEKSAPPWRGSIASVSSGASQGSQRYHEAMLPLPSERNGIRRPTETRAMAITKFRMIKFNSTSTLFVDTTMINADLRESIRYASLYLSEDVRKNLERGVLVTEDILSEQLHKLSKHIQFYLRPPSPDEVFRFLECLFQSAELNVECVIITLIYIKRLLKNTGITMHPINWARIVLGGVILASKVWDDHAVWNADYCQIFPDVPVSDLNDLEQYCLGAINYDVSVRASTYATFYFELRELADLCSRPWTLKPLLKKETDKLQAKPQAPINNKPTESKDDDNPEGDVMTASIADLHLKTRRADRKLRKSYSDYVFVPPEPPAFVL